MKKLAIAGLLAAALSLTSLSQQKASAWGCCGGSSEFNFSIGLSISCGCSHSPCCSPCGGGCGYSLCPDVSAYQGCGYGGYCAAPYAAPYYAPQAAPLAAPTAATGVQNADYTYPAGYTYPSGNGYGYNYGYYQAPSYWYGR